MIRKIILENIQKYPYSEITDIVKLVFQNEFGGGHLISDEKVSLERLRKEIGNTEFNKGIPFSEDIGNGISRLNLANLRPNITAEAINLCFIASAKEIVGTKDSFENKISEIYKLCRENLLPFGVKELDQYMEKYRNAGYPPVSHSEKYRSSYKPAYRILKNEYIDLLEAVTLIEKVARREKVLVAIDGRCASGKTTLAEKLKRIFNCAIIHMDDFFLPFEKRTHERLAEPGGNIDYERFEKEILNSFHKSAVFSYGVFNCNSGKIESERVIKPSNIIITEGSYSLHPKFSDSYNVKIFVSTDSDTQIERIKARNGEKMLKMFKDKWIPMEENYINTFHIDQIADIILIT